MLVIMVILTIILLSESILVSIMYNKFNFGKFVHVNNYIAIISKFKKTINFKKEKRDHYLNKMKILVMNSITLKIPILTATNIILPLYNSSQNKDLKCS